MCFATLALSYLVLLYEVEALSTRRSVAPTIVTALFNPRIKYARGAFAC
jgi:hypothetical protein